MRLGTPSLITVLGYKDIKMERLLRRILFLLLFVATVFPIQMTAQDTKVAVWGPSVKPGSEKVEAIEFSIINSRFRDAVSAMSGIELISRTDVDNILSELKFQQNGMVSENDKKLLGQMKGVDIIVSLLVAKGFGYVNIESSFIDVEKAKVIGRTQSVLAEANNPVDLVDKCVELAGKLTGVTSSSSGSSYPSRPSFTNDGTDIPFTVGNVTFKMVFVKGGTFLMGSYSGDDDEKPVHSVTVSDFYICEFEVTQALWQEVMGTTVYQQRDKANTTWPMCGVGANYPMYYVHHSEAEEFCRRLNQRLRGQLTDGYSFALPTEAEWEYAAKGGIKSKSYMYAGSNFVSDVAYYYDNSSGTTHQVGSKKPNELGIYDMSGNVSEWCADWYGTYGSSSQTDPRGSSTGSYRVERGGSWCQNSLHCRVAGRDYNSPGFRFGGFRLALVRR